MFTIIDKYFFDIVLAFKDKFEKVITDSLRYKLHINEETAKTGKIIATKNGKETEHSIIIFGRYDRNKEVFEYLIPSNIIREHMEKQQFDKIVGNSGISNKLFNDKVKIEKKYHYVIPYLISIYNPLFSLVRFTTENNKVDLYALIDLKLKEYFTQNDFDTFMTLVKINYKDMGKNNMSRNKNKRTSKKSKRSK